MNKPQPQKQSIQGNKSVSIQAQMYRGQLPPPEMLEKFEKITPGFSDRLLTMVEQEAASKRDFDRKQLSSFHLSAVLGIICALIAVLFVCTVSIYALYKGYSVAAASIMGTSAAAVIIAFLQRKARAKNEK